MDLKGLQRDALVRMVNLEFDGSSSSGGRTGEGGLSDPLQQQLEEDRNNWKLLVYDDRCRDILAPLINRQQLGELGVTLDLSISTKRQRVAGAVAVYFVEPTAENIERIAQDCREDLYDRVYLNFSRKVEQSLLMQLAKSLVESNRAGKIARVYDQYSDFVSLESRLFSCYHEKSFAQLYAGSSEKAISSYLDSVVDSLFSVLATLGAIPVIRSCPNGAAQMAAERLHEKLRNSLQGGGKSDLFENPRSGGSFFRRPLLVLVDRIQDLCVPLHHTMTYTALMNDILGMQANRVTVKDLGGAAVDDDEKKQEAGGGSARVSSRTLEYDLDDATDTFWNATGGLPFAQVAEAQTKFLKHWMAASREVGEKADSKDAASFGLVQTDDIASAIRSIPEMQKQKRLLDMHTNILTSLLRQLQKRSVDAFMEQEEEFIHSKDAKYDRKRMRELLRHSGATLADKLRLLIVFSLSSHYASAGEMAELQKILEEQAVSCSPEERRILDALQYLKQYKFEQQSFSANGGLGGGLGGGSGAAGAGGGGGGAASSASGSSSSGLLGQLARSMYGQVRGLVASKENLPLTASVGRLMMPSSSSDSPYSVILDPRQEARGGRVDPAGASFHQNSGFSEVIVFVLGGGNYAEFQNLQDYVQRENNPESSGGGVGGGVVGGRAGIRAGAASRGGKSILYGCTELLSPEQFLEQLADLGRGRNASSGGGGDAGGGLDLR